MITLKFANPGAGKTTDLARMARKELRRIKHGKSPYDYVVTNTPVVGCKYVTDIRVVLKEYIFEKSLILIDEASIIYNNRLMKMTEKEIEYFKLHRHYLCDIVVFSQSWDDVDVTLRRMYDAIYLMRRRPFGWTTSRRIFKMIDLNEEGQLVDKYSYGGMVRTMLNYKFMYRPHHYAYFDSFWRPEGYKRYPVEELSDIPLSESVRSKGIVVALKDRIVYWRKKKSMDDDLLSELKKTS